MHINTNSTSNEAQSRILAGFSILSDLGLNQNNHVDRVFGIGHGGDRFDSAVCKKLSIRPSLCTNVGDHQEQELLWKKGEWGGGDREKQFKEY